MYSKHSYRRGMRCIIGRRIFSHYKNNKPQYTTPIFDDNSKLYTIKRVKIRDKVILISFFENSEYRDRVDWYDSKMIKVVK